MSGWTTGVMSPMSPSAPELSTLWRACIQLRLPRMVLISPLWQSIRKGCARLHCGNVFVEKREWTIAIALVNHWLVRSVKYSRSWRLVSMPLYTMFRLDREQI